MNPHVTKWLSKNGAKGGASGTGAAKARPSHVARRAAKIGQTMRHLKPGYRLCEKCGGSGHNDFYMDHECGYCGGTGQVVENSPGL